MANAAEDLEIEETPETPEAEVIEPEAGPTPDELAGMERARRMGWRPKEEYSGNVARWVDWDVFLQRGETELPVLRERFRKMDSQFGAQTQKLQDTEKKLEEVTSVMMELRDMSRQAQEQAYQRALREIASRERKAVAEADTAAYEAAAAERAGLVPPMAAPRSDPPPRVATTPPAAPQTPQTNPVIDAWIADNSWFQTDQSMHFYARQMDTEVEREHPGWPLTEKLAEVRRRVVSKYPEKFGEAPPAAPRPMASRVAVSALPTPKPKAKGVKDLPREAQAAFARFKRMMPNYTEAEYMAMYGKD